MSTTEPSLPSKPNRRRLGSDTSQFTHRLAQRTNTRATRATSLEAPCRTGAGYSLPNQNAGKRRSLLLASTEGLGFSTSGVYKAFHTQFLFAPFLLPSEGH